MKRSLIVAIAIALLCIAAQGKVRTTQRQLRDTNSPVPRIELSASDSIDAVRQDCVSLRGYGKRASDAKESFFMTNHTPSRLSEVRLTLRYTLLDGTLLHQRDVKIPVDLPSGSSKLVTIPTFDVQRQFYYYGGPKPRKSATPFRVSYRLNGYSIAIGR